MRVQMTVTGIDTESIMKQFVETASTALSEAIGPHLLDACRGKAPVGKEHSVTQRRALRPVALKPLGSFPKGSEDAERLFSLHGLEPRELSGSINPLTDARFFQGVRDTHYWSTNKRYKGADRNKGKTPDLIEVSPRGGIKGGFQHRAGTLRDSHVLEEVKVSGGTVSIAVRATAPYARAVHDGFEHKGGPNHTGATTTVKGRKWMTEALKINVKDDITSAFKG